MKDEHYLLMIEKTKPFIGKIDGDDINEILRQVDLFEWDDGGGKYDILIKDLNDMVNIMWCEYGLDYGKTQDWDITVLKILYEFEYSMYKKNNDDLEKLIELIEKGIEK